MMDATALFPQGFHPVRTAQLPNDIRTAAPNLRRASTPVTYYFIDFGISSVFAPNDTDRMVAGRDGLDDQVPELSDTTPYDPFKVDVFVVGNLFRRAFVEVC